MPYVGELGICGIAKENTLGQFTAPTEFLRFVPPFDFSTDITPIIGQGVQGIPDVNKKWAQGPAQLKSGKLKIEAEPENIGNTLMSTFGTDTAAETASFLIATGTNDKIDFVENGGSDVAATVAAGTYKMGTDSSVALSLCKAVKTALEAAGTPGAYTVTYSYSTKKMTITKATGTILIKWLSGTNNAKGCYAVLGWTKADTSAALAVTSNSTTAVAPFTHTFTRVNSATLPSYSIWQKNGPDYPEHSGCMMNKLDIDIKKGEFIMFDGDWAGLLYNAAGTTQTPSWSALRPFKFDQAALTVGGSSNTDIQEMKITLQNDVAVEHVVGSTIYGTKIYSKGWKVAVAGTIIVEDVTEWTKFINGTDTALVVTVTSSEAISGVTPAQYYVLTITIPQINYRAMPRPMPKDLLKISFTGDAIYNVASSATATATLKNTVATAY